MQDISETFRVDLKDLKIWCPNITHFHVSGSEDNRTSNAMAEIKSDAEESVRNPLETLW